MGQQTHMRQQGLIDYYIYIGIIILYAKSDEFNGVIRFSIK